MALLNKMYYLKDHCGFFLAFVDGVEIFSAKVLLLACLNYLDQFFIAESDSNLCDCNSGYRWDQRERTCVTCSRLGRRAASWGGAAGGLQEEAFGY